MAQHITVVYAQPGRVARQQESPFLSRTAVQHGKQLPDVLEQGVHVYDTTVVVLEVEQDGISNDLTNDYVSSRRFPLGPHARRLC